MIQLVDLDDLDFNRLSIDTTVEYEDGRPGPQTWHVRVETDDDQGRPTGVFWMDGWTFRLGAGHHLAGELDALSADTAVFLPLVERDNLSQRLVDELDLVPLGDGLALINHVRLDPQLRGRGGIGRYLTGLVIRELSAGAALVALHASPSSCGKSSTTATSRMTCGRPARRRSGPCGSRSASTGSTATSTCSTRPGQHWTTP